MLHLFPEKGIRVTRTSVRCGQRSVPLLVLSPPGGAKNRPGVLWIHGGGYFMGMKEMVYMGRAYGLVKKYNAVVVSPGYSLAFIRPWPAAADDCYSALEYMNDNAQALGIDPDKLMVGGESAGGGLCAAVCIMARDRGKVRVRFQMPLYPMLDNLDTPTSRNNHGRVWNTRRNHLGWALYLRKDRKNKVSPCASPARCEDFSSLPPAFSFVGDGEPFYFETESYFNRLRESGVPAELRVFHTDIHAFDMLFPKLEISVEASECFEKAFEKRLASLED